MRAGTSGSPFEPSWPARSWSTTAFQTSTIDSRKWPITKAGLSSNSTVSPPSTIWAMTPATSPSDHHVRSRRFGTRTSEPSTANMTASDTRPVIVRFTNSTMAWYSSGATSWFSSQVGQSEHPRPDPVRRTAAPVTMMNARAISARRVMRW